MSKKEDKKDKAMDVATSISYVVMLLLYGGVPLVLFLLLIMAVVKGCARLLS